jgi:hypothetical protein
MQRSQEKTDKGELQRRGEEEKRWSLNCDSHADRKNMGRRGRRKERVVRSKN